MQLTKDQIKAIQTGETVRLQEAGTDIVVVRADLFDRMQVLTYDASPWTAEEMDLLAAEDADRLGWEGMEAYQELDR
jgi:hypothetical protein